MKKTDYQIKKGSEKVQFVRGVKINQKDTNLTIEVTLNHNKGLYTITPKVSTSNVTGDKTLDAATCKVIGDLTHEAIFYCIDWRTQWLSNQPKDGSKQLPMFPDEEEESEG